MNSCSISSFSAECDDDDESTEDDGSDIITLPSSFSLELVKLIICPSAAEDGTKEAKKDAPRDAGEGEVLFLFDIFWVLEDLMVASVCRLLVGSLLDDDVLVDAAVGLSILSFDDVDMLDDIAIIGLSITLSSLGDSVKFGVSVVGLSIISSFDFVVLDDDRIDL